MREPEAAQALEMRTSDAPAVEGQQVRRGRGRKLDVSYHDHAASAAAHRRLVKQRLPQDAAAAGFAYQLIGSSGVQRLALHTFNSDVPKLYLPQDAAQSTAADELAASHSSEVTQLHWRRQHVMAAAAGDDTI